MVVSDLEAVCRSEVQAVLTCLRSSRKFGNLSRSWRELEEGSPVRQLSEWRCTHEAAATAVLRPLLQVAQSPEYSGPPAVAALQAVHAVSAALCEASSSSDLGSSSSSKSNIAAQQSLALTLTEVCSNVIKILVDESRLPSDEAVAMHAINVLSLCATAQAGADTASLSDAQRYQAFSKVLAIWINSRNLPALRLHAQGAMQELLDFALSNLEDRLELLKSIFGRIETDIGPTLSVERLSLYLRFFQRILTHPMARCSVNKASHHGAIYTVDVPMLLLVISDHFLTNTAVMSQLLPLVNHICWLCIDHWCNIPPADTTNGCQPARLFGALHVEAMMTGIYLRVLPKAAAYEEAELMEVVLEALCDLLREDCVCSLWMSFDADWRRPALLEKIIKCLVDLMVESASTEELIPASVFHLCSTILLRVISAFSKQSENDTADVVNAAHQLSQVRAHLEIKEKVDDFMNQMKQSPKRARTTFERSGLMDAVPLPAMFGNSQGNNFEEWAVKLAWVLRCLNHCAPYAAMGEFFGQNAKDSEQAFGAFVDTFDWGNADLHEALRNFLQAFLLPKEAQQIDRVLKIFAHTFYRKHISQDRESTAQTATYLKHEDAAYTLAFSVIMLNTDQYTPNLKKRMKLTDFLRNNEGINEGDNIPEDVQTRIFDSIAQNEIKTPSSGSMEQGLSLSRWSDFLQLVGSGYRDNSLLCPGGPGVNSQLLCAHSRVFVERLGDSVRTALEHSLATDANTRGDSLQALQQLLHLARRSQSCSQADSVAEGLFFFGAEVFHELELNMDFGRASSCLRALFHTAMPWLSSMSTKQLHLMAYFASQFALYGLFDKSLPPVDPMLAKLSRAPSLTVDPPTGLVYSFLRKISTAPFKMLSYAEESSEDRRPQNPAPVPLARSSSGLAIATSGNTGHTTTGNAVGKQADIGAQKPLQATVSPEARGNTLDTNEALSPGHDGEGEAEADGLQRSPLRPQIEKAFEICDLDPFIREVVDLWGVINDTDDASVGPAAVTHSHWGAGQIFLCFLSSLFLALRTISNSKVATDGDMPWWPGPPAIPNISTSQGLQLPKRALSLNLLDGYETLRLALRLLEATVGTRRFQERKDFVWNELAVQELSIAVHVGLFHTLHRSDLNERTLRMAIVGLFHTGSRLLTLQRENSGPIVSVGWPLRLVVELLRRTQSEPQLLVRVAKLCLDATRDFVTEVARVRVLDRLELWKALLLFLLKALPTSARALWPGTKDHEIELVQRQLWREGIVWLLGHTHLLHCISTEGKDGDFWAWALGEMTSLAREASAGANPGMAVQLLIEAYSTILSSFVAATEGSEIATGVNAACIARGTTEGRAKSWSHVAVFFLSYVSPLLQVKASVVNGDLQPVLLIKEAFLCIRVAPMLGKSEQAPSLVAQVLEKLVAVMSSTVNSGAPLSVVRDAVTLVSKFFLHNLQVLRDYECFGQLWLQVLRLMLQFIKRGTDQRDAEFEEVATETLKNMLCVLLGTHLLAYVTPRAANAQEPTQNGGDKVWWQMTWDCIEVFLPGFGQDFSQAILPEAGAQAQQPAASDSDTAAAPQAQQPAASNGGIAAPPQAQHATVDSSISGVSPEVQIASEDKADHGESQEVEHAPEDKNAPGESQEAPAEPHSA